LFRILFHCDARRNEEHCFETVCIAVKRQYRLDCTPKDLLVKLCSLLCSLLCCSVLAPSLPGQGPWSTYRGNPQRTGNTDGKAGPAAPKVFWVYKTQDHFVAAPLPQDDRVLFTGLGAFNISTLYTFASDPMAKERILWKKSSPYLKLPSVSTPALFDKLLIFGDGMHQTDGAILHCLRMEKGQPLWQYQVPGNLVHLEGSPTVQGGKVFLGGGAAGVLCVDLNRVALEGKEMTRESIQKILEEKWTQLQADYLADKKKNPETAIPPTDDMLPRPAPVRLWQQGQEKSHVDAPVAVIDDQVLVASAFLDKEQVGDRALYSLKTGNGNVLWKTPLKLNPWGGPSVIGDTVVVSGSTIGYDIKAIKGARGDIAAFDLKNGKEKWRKDVPAGVVACAALTREIAIVTATDGKVRAFDLGTGERRWIYDAKTPFFAPPAIAGDVAYVGDLLGVIHAIDLATGTAKWMLNLGTDPEVKAPGSIYGGPVVHGGRIYVATCNLEGALGRLPTVVVCIGSK
jgi:outer membrane protein assembly factor BamB